MRRAARETAWVAAMLAAAVALMFWPLLLGRATLFDSDLEMLGYPFRVYFGRWWQAGIFPWWCPLAMCGFPLYAEGQAGAMYPGTWLFGLVQPPWYAMTWVLLAHLWWAGLGTWLWTRRLGADRCGAAAAALTMTFGGTMIAHLVQINVLCGLAWMPFAAWGYECALDGRRWGAVGSGVALGLQALSGYPNVVLLTILLLITRALSHREPARPTAPRSWRTAARPWRILGLAGILGAGLGAVQLLPTQELVPHSGRAERLPWEVANAWRMRAEHVPLLFATTARGTPARRDSPLPELPYEWYCTIGRLPLLLLAIGLVAARTARPWAALVLLVPWFAAGGPLYGLLWRTLLGGRLQGPARLTPLWTTAACAVIALTVTELRRRPALRRIALPAAAAVLAIVLVSGLVAQVQRSPRHPSLTVWGEPAAWIAPLAVFLLGVALVARAPHGKLGIALVFLTFADLWLASASFHPLARPDYFDERDPLTAAVRASGERVHAMFVSHRELGSPHNLLYDVASTSILSPLGLQRVQHALALLETTAAKGASDPGSPAARRTRAMMVRLRVGYITSDLVPGDGAGRPRIVRSPVRAAPPAWVAERWRAGDREQALAALAEPVELEAEAVVEGSGGGIGTGQVCSFRRLGPQRLVIEAEAIGHPLLVTAESAYPGWVAYVNDRPTVWLPVDHIYRGVPLRAGRSEVRWVFQPVSVRLGLFLTLLTVGLLAALVVAKEPSW